jgi:hypothetical protein
MICEFSVEYVDRFRLRMTRSTSSRLRRRSFFSGRPLACTPFKHSLQKSGQAAVRASAERPIFGQGLTVEDKIDYKSGADDIHKPVNFFHTTGEQFEQRIGNKSKS